MAKQKPGKPKTAREEVTLWNVVLSYPCLAKPRQFKGKGYYSLDALMDADDPQVKNLRGLIKKVKQATFGTDPSEYPDGAKKKLVQDGNEREDQKPYKDKLYITCSTQSPVPVVDMRGKDFNTASVKGGMTANVAICITSYTIPGDKEPSGVSIYLQGVQIDPTKKPLPGFGGGRTTEQMFGKKKTDDDAEDGGDTEADEDSEDNEEDEEDAPRGKKGKKPSKPAYDDDESDDDESDDDESDEADDGDEEE